MISLSTIIRFLLFNSDAIRQIAGNRKALIVGLLLVISAGFAREYDGEYLIAEPWHLALPVVASIIGCTAMVLAIACAAYFRGAGDVGLANTYLSFLSVYWMTAPMAWLYAIPVERLLSPADATRANLTLLAIVSLWRVALMVRCVHVLYGASLRAAFMPIILFSDILALLALRFVPGPIFLIMGGVRLTESEQIILDTRFMLGFACVLTLPIWLVAYTLVCTAKTPWRWSALEDQHPAQSSRVSSGVWLTIAASLLVWIPILSWTQRQQRLRWESERLIRAGEFAAFVELAREHSEDSFPPHWDPPPRVGYGEKMPRTHAVMAGLMAHDAPEWIQNRYVEKMRSEAIGRRYYWSDLMEYTDEELEAYVDTVTKLDSSNEIAKHYVNLAHDEFQLGELSKSGRASIERLVELGKSKAKTEDLRPTENDDGH